MIDAAVEVALVVATSVGTSLLARLLTRRGTPPPDDGEKRCSGYRFGRGVVGKMMDDCTALRSKDCEDGRCKYHCSQMCRCQEVFNEILKR